tara:strand:- start:282 stop:1049 length:768 start_codon:yes stop_codon:yes gene_type:complete
LKYRECKVCKETLPITDFPQVQLTGPNSIYRRWDCKECHNYKKLNDPVEYERQKLLEEERKKLSNVGKKRCSMCEIVQPLDDFPNDFSGKVHENKKSYCKSCGYDMRKAYVKTPAGKLMKKKSDKKYRKNHKKQISDHLKKRYKNDEQFRLSILLRGRLKKVVDRKHIPTRSEFQDILGCSYEELVIHLELQFTDGMNWDNHGLYGWHIDHIIPLSAFDLTDIKQLAESCHYTNLQPLWAEDNYSKGNKLNWKSI